MYDEMVKRLREVSLGAKDTLWWQAADAIEEQSKPKWISVKERLPEAKKEVIVCDKMPNRTRYVTTAWISEDCTFWNDCGRMYEVTHWMPLPKPPKEE